MILSKQKWCLLLTCVSTESQKRTSVLQIMLDFVPTSNMTRMDLHWVIRSFNFLIENKHVQFDGIVYQNIVGIPMGIDCAPLKADLFLNCLRWILCLNCSKLNELTSLKCLTIPLNILTLYSPSVTLNENHVPDMYQRTSFSRVI